MSNYPKLDLLREKEGLNTKTESKKRGLVIFAKVLLALFIVSAIAGSLFSYKLITAGKDVFNIKSREGSIFQQLRRLVFSQDKLIAGEEDGRTNILLLGMGGEGHQGALLTDTIMIVSINHNGIDEKKDVAMISIPRDLYVPLNNDGFYRINSIYSIGETHDNYENGSALISQVVSNITDIPIHYYVRVNFDGFKEVVDSLGGVDVYVDRSFYDSQYPTENYGYQTVVFKKGMNNMDGDKALKYARSRHGIVIDDTGNEASDFARAERQQKILTAIRDKALSLETIVNPKVITDSLQALGNNIRTDLEPWEMLKMGELAKSINQEEIINKVIDHGENGFLYSTTASSGAYVLLPKKKDYSQIKSFVRNIFEIKHLKDENIKIEVLNGTSSEGLATRTGNILSFEEYNIVSIGNATNIKSDVNNTRIYTLGDNKKDYTVSKLQQIFPGSEIIDINHRSEVVDPETSEEINTDIIVVLGDDAIDQVELIDI